MYTLEATQTLRGVAETADIVTVSVFGDEAATSDDDFTTLYQGQLSASVDILYTTPSSHSTLVKSISVRNTHPTLSKWVEFFVGGVDDENSVARFIVPANGMATYDGHWSIYDENGQISFSGAPGADGASGSTWYEGTGVPDSGNGVDGDFYLDDATGDVYEKAAGAWGVDANILGPQGDTGPAGADGDDGAPGATGATGPAPAGQVFLSAAGMWPSTTSGATAAALIESSTNKQNQYVLAFPDGSTKYAECTFAMPSDWDGGTVTAKFYWRSTATSGVVKWQAEGRSYGDAETIDQAFGTAQTVTDTQTGTASQMLISAATSAMTFAGTPAAGELIQMRIARLGSDGSDTLTVDARLVGVMITFTRV